MIYFILERNDTFIRLNGNIRIRNIFQVDESSTFQSVVYFLKSD